MAGDANKVHLSAHPSRVRRPAEGPPRGRTVKLTFSLPGPLRDHPYCSSAPSLDEPSALTAASPYRAARNPGCRRVCHGPLSIMDDGGEKDFWFPTRSLFCWDFLKMAQTLIAGWEEPIGDYDFSWRLISFILTARFGNFRTLKDGCCFRY